ncbi:MAG: hypothetical protein K2L49_04590, partial [Muribaculaceae bacterium]|nr:hypothetical protein [Muribaculaceae bacterium]
YEVTPLRSGSNDTGVNTDKMYRNVTERFRWGGLDEVKDPSDIYLDETVRRMVLTHRSALFDLAYELYLEGYRAEMAMAADSAAVAVDPHERYAKALEIMRLMDEKLPVAASPYGIQFGARLANLYQLLGEATADDDAIARGEEILASELRKYAEVIVYYQHLTPWQYSTLPTNDQYIRLLNYGNGNYDSYFETLLESYIRVAGIDKAEAMIQELQDMGVDFMAFPMMRRGLSDVDTVGEAS